MVIASLQFRQAAETACRAAGLQKEQDYLTHLAIPRPVAVIEVTEGRALGGHFGCFAARRSGERQMSAATFRQVLAKLLTDQPQLCHVELSWLGDPLHNPELADIVGHLICLTQPLTQRFPGIGIGTRCLCSSRSCCFK